MAVTQHETSECEFCNIALRCQDLLGDLLEGRCYRFRSKAMLLRFVSQDVSCQVRYGVPMTHPAMDKGSTIGRYHHIRLLLKRKLAEMFWKMCTSCICSKHYLCGSSQCCLNGRAKHGTGNSPSPRATLEDLCHTPCSIACRRCSRRSEKRWLWR